MDTFICPTCNKNIPSQFYSTENYSCNVCYKLLLNIDQPCDTCKLVKNIHLFERPYLRRCKECAAKESREKYSKAKVQCEYCH